MGLYPVGCTAEWAYREGGLISNWVYWAVSLLRGVDLYSVGCTAEWAYIQLGILVSGLIVRVGLSSSWVLADCQIVLVYRLVNRVLSLGYH